jgi:hypothetical protein
MSFPWDSLITAVSTLVAGFGGISWTDRRDAARYRERSRQDAYLELMLALDEFRRVLGAPETLDGQALSADSLGAAVGHALAPVQRAYFSVFLTGTPRVQLLAGKAWQAAWDVNDWVNGGGHTTADIGELRELLTALGKAGQEFADAARREEAGRRLALLGNRARPLGTGQRQV